MAFSLVRSTPLPDLQGTLWEYRHTVTGLRHYHVAWQDPQYAFLVAFPTQPETSDGRAHVLEHLVLCGSRDFPVRDPFFEMTRRSVATFMNAMTYADQTVYPFATPNAQDFDHLLQVYLDTTFHPTLDRLDFLQEGWRWSLDEADQLAYEGVVFNEMKGAFMDGQRAMFHAVQRALYAGTLYAEESGGDPLHIPELTLDALRAFHDRHYHPSHAVVMTSGPTLLPCVHERLERALVGMTARKDGPLRDKPQATLHQSITTTALVPVQGDPTAEHSVVLAFPHGPSLALDDANEAQMYAQALLGSLSSPLQRRFAQAGYGRPGQLCHLDQHHGSLVLLLSMDGLRANETEAALALLREALTEVAREGIAQARLDELLRDVTVQERQRSGGRLPYALQVLLETVPHALYGPQDPLPVLSSDAQLEVLRTRLTPERAQAWAQRLLEGVCLTQHQVPDPEFFGRRAAEEARQIAGHQARLDAEARDRIRQTMAALAAAQERVNPTDVLPRITVADLHGPVLPDAPHATHPSRAHVAAALRGTGVVQLAWDASQLPLEERLDVAMAWSLALDLGLGDRSWEVADGWRRGQAALWRTHSQLWPMADGQGHRWLLGMQVSDLDARLPALAQAVAAQLQERVRFDDPEHLLFLMQQNLDQTRQQLVASGHQLAQQRLLAGFGDVGVMQYTLEGLPALAHEAALLAQLQRDPHGAIARLSQAWARALALPRVTGSMGGPAAEALGTALDATAVTRGTLAGSASAALPREAQASVALLADTAVQHHRWAVPAPGLQHPDAPALLVLGSVLTNGFLHRAVREQGGAYGGSAHYAPDAQAFVMASFRDPRLEGTFADFERARTHVLTHALDGAQVDEGIRRGLQAIDAPQAPLALAQLTWRRQLTGQTLERRQALRDRLLGVTAAEVRAVAERWLVHAPASRVAFTHPQHTPTLERLGFAVEPLPMG